MSDQLSLPIDAVPDSIGSNDVERAFAEGLLLVEVDARTGICSWTGLDQRCVHVISKRASTTNRDAPENRK